MNTRQDMIWDRAVELLHRSPTWHELHSALKAEGLDERLGPEGMQDLLDKWHAESAKALTDAALAQEITFWANGGNYTSHLRGFQAIPPEVLVAAAETRGWFVKITPSRRAIINPPEGRPLMVQLTLVTTQQS